MQEISHSIVFLTLIKQVKDPVMPSKEVSIIFKHMQATEFLQ